MYAVIRSGGKQYRVTPGDVIKVESLGAAEGNVHFDVLAVSNGDKFATGNSGAKVTGEVMNQGRGDKILVFKFKRKKQYKKMIGHRQDFTAVRITEISFDGEKATAPALPAKKVKAPKAEAAPAKSAKPAGKKAAAKKPVAKKAAAKKGKK
jgi:large subunit ribosomal protein L21